MKSVKFPLKAITIYSKEEKRFDYENNHGRDKSANFWLDNINKINCRMLVIFSYTSSRLGLKKV